MPCVATMTTLFKKDCTLSAMLLVLLLSTELSAWALLSSGGPSTSVTMMGRTCNA